MDSTRVFRRGVLLLGCCGGLFLLGGCFDYEETFRLKADGSGEITMVTTFSSDMMSDLSGSEMTMDSTVVSSASVERHQETREGKLISTERAIFDTLDQLAMEDRIYRVESLDQPKRYRLSATFFMEEEDQFALTPGDETGGMDDAAKAMMASMFAGHRFTARLEVPGKMVDAPALKLEDHEVIPERSESAATFAIPMDRLFAAGSPGNITLTVDFEGDFNLDGDHIESVKAESPEEPTVDAAWPVGMEEEPSPPQPAAPSEPVGEEEKAYVSNLSIRNVNADRLMEPAEVSGEIKNQGTRTVQEIGVVVYCLDAEGKPMDEVRGIALSTRRGDSPLRPHYSKKFHINLKDVASDWSGQVEVKIDSVKFAE